MSDSSIISFFESLVDDEIEKKIIRLVSKDYSDDEIIEILLGIKEERSSCDKL
ncbi:hypothetical protein [Methanosarcina mazei]|uniref:hypothetical protein n=1 Tax=Methanosarcina mazei TaxID=2209 RepID=UPI000A617CF2|nr:hypothetical protein [Methanosarcina mazei]